MQSSPDSLLLNPAESNETSTSLHEHEQKKRYDKTPKPRRHSKIEEADNESMEISEEMNNSI